MKTKLKVLNSKSAGKELPIALEKFLIGRDADCQLRPGSDAIAAKHCQLTRRDGGFWAKDLGSETGTFVNGQQIASETKLNSGDKLRVGPLEFEVMIEYEVGGQRAEKVKDVRDAAARLVKKADKELDIDSLLSDDEDEADEAPRSRQFDLNEITSAVDAEKEAAEAAREAKELKKSGGKKFGKLPKKEEDKTAPKDTRDAANEMLRKMFKK
ncbi:MAG: FHA domain-containing protein [Pirellulales bacterium]